MNDRLKILIADDDFSSRRIMKAFLEDYGTIDMTVDGEETLFAFKTALKEGEPYDLICLDIMMPKVDGQEVLKQIRTAEQEKGILGKKAVKVVMTTALDDPQNVMESFKSDATGYITKPFDEEDFLQTLKELKIL
jgi:two-component system chemotaxis response regulator CheY